MEERGPARAVRVSTGVEGLDELLHGGLIGERLYLLEGTPGAGKTTIGLQFLREGLIRGENVMYVTLAETVEELAGAAASHGWSLDGIDMFEVGSETARGRDDYTLFHPSEVELSERLQELFRAIDQLAPSRVVVDSLSELRLLARDSLRFRRQILALKKFFSTRGSTVIVLDDQTTDLGDRQMHSLAHGVMTLEMVPVEYGSDRRRAKVTKLRGSTFSGGYHDMAIRTGGVVVFPRLIAQEHVPQGELVRTTSGLPDIDRLLGGGLFEGASTLLLGPAGSGKSVLASVFACAAAAQGKHVAMYALDESRRTLISRSRALGLAIDAPLADGRLTIEQVDPAEMSAGEFTHRVRERVIAGGARMVVIDSVNGFLHAVPGDRTLLLQLHELLTYLARQGVATVLVEAQLGLVSAAMRTPLDVSYLADVVILHRLFELRGELRRAISVVKHRLSAHESTIHELTIGVPIRVGPPLREFQGVIAGTPIAVGPIAPPDP